MAKKSLGRHQSAMMAARGRLRECRGKMTRCQGYGPGANIKARAHPLDKCTYGERVIKALQRMGPTYAGCENLLSRARELAKNFESNRAKRDGLARGGNHAYSPPGATQRTLPVCWRKQRTSHSPHAHRAFSTGPMLRLPASMWRSFMLAAQTLPFIADQHRRPFD